MATATSSRSDEWPTPGWLVDELAAEFAPGGFDLDPAADPGNAKAPRYFTRDDDGLAQPWKGRVFCNPPYGATIRKWIRKAVAETSSGNADRVIMLVPARPDTRWWREATRSAALVRLWPGRIEFAPGIRAPFPSAVLVFGILPGRHGADPAWCTVCGRLFWPARSDYRACSRRCRRALGGGQVSRVTRSPASGSEEGR